MGRKLLNFNHRIQKKAEFSIFLDFEFLKMSFSHHVVYISLGNLPTLLTTERKPDNFSHFILKTHLLSQFKFNVILRFGRVKKAKKSFKMAQNKSENSNYSKY